MLKAVADGCGGNLGARRRAKRQRRYQDTSEQGSAAGVHMQPFGTPWFVEVAGRKVHLIPPVGLRFRSHNSAELSVSYLSAIGLMSGTSYDGVDVALINTDGESIGRLGPTGYRAYDDSERAVLRRAIACSSNLTDRNDRTGVLAEAEAVINAAHAEAVTTFLHANGLSARDVAVVGFHGQTVLHQPDRHLTVQLGSGADARDEARHPGGLRLPRRRCRRRRGGGAAGVGPIIVRWCGCSTARSRSACSISAASPM